MKKKRIINIDNIKVIVYCEKEESDKYKEELSTLYSKNNGILKELFLNKYDTLIINSNKNKRNNNKLFINNISLESSENITENLINGLIDGNELKEYLKEIFFEENKKDEKTKLLKEFLKIGIKENDFSKIIKYINNTNIFDKQKIITDFAQKNFKEELEQRSKQKNTQITNKLKQLCIENYIIQYDESGIVELLNKYSSYGELLIEKEPNQNNRTIKQQEKLSTETILTLLKEILNYMIPTGELLNYFNESLNNGKVVIYDKENERINKYLKKKIQCDTVDYCYKDGVIYCPLDHNIFDVICIAHEFGHLYNKDRIKGKENKDETLVEFPSIFFEYLAITYLNNNKNLDKETKEKLNNFRINSNAVTTYMFKKELEVLKVFLRDREINNQNVIQLGQMIVNSTKETVGFNINNIYDVTNYVYNNVIYSDNINTLFHNIGYIVGLELTNELISDNGIRKAFGIVYSLMDKMNSKEYKTEDVMCDLTTKRKIL